MTAIVDIKAREILDIHRKIECHPIEIDRLRLK